jgi:hypothetical protein
VNPETPAGVALLGAGPWALVLGLVFLWRLLRPRPTLPEAAAEDSPGDLDDSAEAGPVADDDYTDSVPFDTGVLIGAVVDGDDE